MTQEELFEKLKNLTYEYKSDYDGSKWPVKVIEKEEFWQVESLIRQYLLDTHDAEMGELKAKVYTYEAIIANSNFATILPNNRLAAKCVESEGKNEHI